MAPSARGRTTARVAIIGSGFSGIAAAIALKKKGIEDFIIFEQSPGLGGTWWHNRYPGAEVDLESHIYSFSYERYDWSRTHAGWQELQGYLEHVARKWDLHRHILFNEKVESVTWSDENHDYVVSTESGTDHGRFMSVVSAVGFLNIPLYPPFAREATDYEGALCHTSRWIDGLDLTDKAIGVVGTGSSAVQVVTEAEKAGSEVKIFQLEPNWLMPKESRDFTEQERKLNRFAPVYAWRRFKLYADYDKRQYRASHARADGRTNKIKREQSLAFMQRELGDRPDLMELVTPKFAYEARRTVVSDTYYGALKSPKVTLVPHGVKGLTRTGAVDANGDEHNLDVIILATGFDASNYLGNYRVRGENGADLHSQWEGEPEAFLGMMVPGFPNFFMMYGPNTNASPLVSFYEAQASFAAGLISRAAKKGRTRISVRRSAFLIYNDWVQNALGKTVWATTRNYFQSGSGKIVSQWPFSGSAYITLTKLLRRLAVKTD
ncbi:flavin-containing monooxygenase [Rhodococcus wratislaviensis]|uniref:flavin-containing monooxygenase n=1 Tax=Rhodococcus wratislaviensis TaxID=44752 RepID=UPI003652FD86